MVRSIPNLSSRYPFIGIAVFIPNFPLPHVCFQAIVCLIHRDNQNNIFLNKFGYNDSNYLNHLWILTGPFGTNFGQSGIRTQQFAWVSLGKIRACYLGLNVFMLIAFVLIQNVYQYQMQWERASDGSCLFYCVHLLCLIDIPYATGIRVYHCVICL